MIQLNFLDANGNVVHNLPNINSINLHFNNSLNISSVPALVMDLMANHSSVNFNGVNYHFSSLNTNINGTTLITYKA